jgi:hypothetical protein
LVPAGWHDAEARAVVVTPAIGKAILHRELEVEDDWQVHEHDVAIGDREVVDQSSGPAPR